uniref:Palmitoyltransferase n=1 Tax=Chromera velia CCMP2878 TaxID=1169474 RepID=A0A0G4FGT2_9ALVE|eukprot:Cvel_16938.t1-p1 / transcript=Cvel_16938.t1 / gene=Cvel_16938 / organism=Chromera_velia_CCMP2878 / gene_product=Palmitoyltransferase PFA4, putative / transcript_product=Palmitoyltransferase PFA4, putative / location=Cvel_scaffold1328:13438-18757(-) / protein_length=682 / sequence_SO=supercontig / SO=protein_coding / is_pseudo=false
MRKARVNYTGDRGLETSGKAVVDFSQMNSWVKMGTLTLGVLYPSFVLFVFLPEVLDFGCLEGMVILFVCLWESVLFLFNLWMVCMGDPGVVLPEHQEVNGEYCVDSLRYSPRYCEACRLWKPPRAHHSRSLGRCVLRFDHWCPFVANGIGFKNHGHYFLMFLYSLVGALTGWTLLLWDLWSQGLLLESQTPFLKREADPSQSELMKHLHGALKDSAILSGGMLTLGVSPMMYLLSGLQARVLFLLGWRHGVMLLATLGVSAFALLVGLQHVLFPLGGRTTVERLFPSKEFVEVVPEFWLPVSKDFFSSSTWGANLKQILGNNWALRLALPVHGEMGTDGTRWVPNEGSLEVMRMKVEMERARAEGREVGALLVSSKTPKNGATPSTRTSALGGSEGHFETAMRLQSEVVRGAEEADKLQRESAFVAANVYGTGGGFSASPVSGTSRSPGAFSGTIPAASPHVASSRSSGPFPAFGGSSHGGMGVNEREGSSQEDISLGDGVGGRYAVPPVRGDHLNSKSLPAAAFRQPSSVAGASGRWDTGGGGVQASSFSKSVYHGGVAQEGGGDFELTPGSLSSRNFRGALQHSAAGAASLSPSHAGVPGPSPSLGGASVSPSMQPPVPVPSPMGGGLQGGVAGGGDVWGWGGAEEMEGGGKGALMEGRSESFEEAPILPAGYSSGGLLR